ncbi:MAG: PIN domain-containing protein [Acidobacteria bacterium]|nr:PIN domain-containing protein [Acidobacteriota bacterium]
MAHVLVDTSAVYALVDRSDANHATARAALTTLRKRRAEPLLTNFIVAESHALLLARLGGSIARTWLLSNAWPIERVTEEDEARARAIIARYSDKTYSYTDATSFAVMERRVLKVAFAFDPHFRLHGFQLLDANH